MAGVVCVVMPRVRIGSSSLCCPRFSSVLCVVVCLLWVGKCGGVWCVVCGVNNVGYFVVGLCPAILFCICVCCHGIVGLGLCLCDSVV